MAYQCSFCGNNFKIIWRCPGLWLYGFGITVQKGWAKFLGIILGKGSKGGDIWAFSNRVGLTRKLWPKEG